MARPLRIQLLLLAALVLALTVRSVAGARPRRQWVLGEDAGAPLQDVDVRNPIVRQALDTAVSVYSQTHKDRFLRRVLRARARVEVLGGVSYFLDVELCRNTGTKSQSNLTNCPFSEEDEQKTEICSFQVYSRHWLSGMLLTTYRCHSA